MVILVATGAAAVAGNRQAADLTFSGFHDDQYGKFSDWSSAIDRGPAQVTLEYAVCNFDRKIPLIYQWQGPNFGVGGAGALPPGKCDILDRDVTAYEADTNAVIYFTQAARAQPASAHVSKPPIDSTYLPAFIRDQLRAFYGPEGRSSQPTLADLRLIQSLSPSGYSLQETISWFPPTVSIAIPADAFGSRDARGVIERIEKGGYQAKASTLEETLDKRDMGRVPRERLKAPVIVIRRDATSPSELSLLLGGKALAVSRSYMTMLDSRSGRLVLDAEVSVYATK